MQPQSRPQPPARILIKRCYSFGGATFLPDDNGNFQSVDKWQGQSIELAIDTVRKSIGTDQTLVIFDTESKERIPLYVTIDSAEARIPPIIDGVINEEKLFSITVFTRLKTM